MALASKARHHAQRLLAIYNSSAASFAAHCGSRPPNSDYTPPVTGMQQETIHAYHRSFPAQKECADSTLRRSLQASFRNAEAALQRPTSSAAATAQFRVLRQSFEGWAAGIVCRADSRGWTGRVYHRAGLLHRVEEIPIDEDVTVNYVSEPDAFLTNVHTGRNGLFTGCRAATYDVNIQANLPGLTYVRDVELFGLSVPAYELHPGSPLVGIVAIIENSGSPTGRLPLSMGPNTTQYTTRSGSFGLDFRLYTRLFARGGPTSGAPYGNLGTIEITLQQAPGLSVTVPVSLGIQMRSPTCTIGDNSVVLDNVSADALPAVGRPIGEKTFNMQMNCLTAGANVTLQIVDALDSGNVGSRLTPTSDSDARGWTWSCCGVVMR